MKSKSKPSLKSKFLFWLPRISAIIFTLFISVFALDALANPNWPLALLIHLLPVFLLIMVTYIAWKHPHAGASLFILSGLVAIVFFQSWLLAVPVWLIGLLFLIGHKS